MKLKAINAIYRKEGKKQVRVEPGAEFTCPDEEAAEYLAGKAAMQVEEAKKAPAKKAPAKKASAKKAEPKPEPKPEEGAEGEDGQDLLED